MKKLIFLIMALFAGSVYAERQNANVSMTDFDCGEGFTCDRVVGNSVGNHELDCTIIRPWVKAPDAEEEFPVIAWANGWDQGNVAGQCTTNGYIPGLKNWAESVRIKGVKYKRIVVAANAWSAQESDVLRCLEYVVSNEPNADSSRTGLSGHSQGGGAVIKAGGEKIKGKSITTVIPMNPYGPSWVNPGDQGGPMLLLGGDMDTTAPVGSYLAVWDAVQVGEGGILAIHKGGTHNNDAWGTYNNGETMSCEDASEVDFGIYYGPATELWWRKQLHDDAAAGNQLDQMLADEADWCTSYSGTPDCF
jgi:hypothetical protein